MTCLVSLIDAICGKKLFLLLRGKCYTQGLHAFWKGIGTDYTVFQDLESFRKGRFFKMSIEKFWIFVWETLKHPKMDIIWFCIKQHMCYICSFCYL